MDEMMAAILPLLDDIIQNPEKGLENVRKFQKRMGEIEEDPSDEDELLWEELRDLVYDLAYYEPDERVRRSDPSLYGEDRMKEKVLSVIVKIRKSGLA